MQIPNAPLYRDPIHDGAADPTIIWNPEEQAWWMLYTNRRADAPGSGHAWVHGTDIGVASSTDGGKTWLYRGVLPNLAIEPGRNTFWAPEVLLHEGIFHMYVSYVRGVPDTWDFPPGPCSTIQAGISGTGSLNRGCPCPRNESSMPACTVCRISAGGCSTRTRTMKAKALPRTATTCSIGGSSVRW